MSRKHTPNVAFLPNKLSEERRLHQESEQQRKAQAAMESQRITYKAVAAFDRVEDAQAIKELLSEMGVDVFIEVTQNNRPLAASKDYVASDTRLGKLMLEYMRRNHSRIYQADDFASLLTQRSYAPASASVMLHKMANETHVTKVGRGEYMLSGPDCEMIMNKRGRTFTRK